MYKIDTKNEAKSQRVIPKFEEGTEKYLIFLMDRAKKIISYFGAPIFFSPTVCSGVKITLITTF